jgi:hypothetical protein
MQQLVLLKFNSQHLSPMKENSTAADIMTKIHKKSPTAEDVLLNKLMVLML